MPRTEKTSRLEYQRSYQNEWYAKNKTKVSIKNAMSRIAYRNWFQELRSKYQCEKCGESHPATLDFHHIDPKTKHMGIAQMISLACSKSRILKEIDKCQCLCSNCHRKHHWEVDEPNRIASDQKWKEMASDNGLDWVQTRARKPIVKKCKHCSGGEDTISSWRRNTCCLKCYNERQRQNMRKRRRTSLNAAAL